MGKFVSQLFEKHPIAQAIAKHIQLDNQLNDFVSRFGLLTILMQQDGEIAQAELLELMNFAINDLSIDQTTAKKIVNSTLDVLDENDFNPSKSAQDFCQYMCESHDIDTRHDYVKLLKRLALSDNDYDDDEQSLILDAISELIN